MSLEPIILLTEYKPMSTALERMHAVAFRAKVLSRARSLYGPTSGVTEQALAEYLKAYHEYTNPFGQNKYAEAIH